MTNKEIFQDALKQYRNGDLSREQLDWVKELIQRSFPENEPFNPHYEDIPT